MNDGDGNRGIRGVSIEDDPNDIASYLVQQHGRAGALQEATRQGYEAQSDGRFYELSVWREVKRILRELRDQAS